MNFTAAFALALIVSLLNPAHPENTAAAISFLESLDRAQREKTVLPFDDGSKSRWHYLPAATWSRPGISLKELNDEQEALLFKLLKASLSESGYWKTKQIIDLEDILAEMGGDPDYRDPEKYHAVIYGNPEDQDIWAWSFEGHHISLNFTITQTGISMAPRFLGANPATIPHGDRKGHRTLESEEELGFRLIRGMTSDQLDKAIFSTSAPRDIVTTNQGKVDPLDPAGIRMDELDKEQQKILWDLIHVYLSVMPADLAKERRKGVEAEKPGEIRFAWAGATEPGHPHYYRIQGSSFLVEFDNTQNNANHIHTVWRDFEGDFGRDLIREHYQHSHHH